MTLAFQAHLGVVPLEQIQGYMAYHRKILGRVVSPHARLVLVEANIETPVERVLYAPVLAHTFGKMLDMP